MKPADLQSPDPASLDDNEPSLELAGLLHVLLRRSWVIALVAVACGLAAGAYVQRIPEEFQSKTVIQIESQATRPIKVEDGSTEDLRDPLVMETVIENFRNRSLMERIAHELHLADDPAFLGRSDPLPASEAEVVALLSSSVTVTARPKTLLVDIGFTHSNPKVAQRLAASIVDQFLLQNTAQQVGQVEAQNSLLLQKEAELKAKLERSELAVQDYKNRMESVSMDAGRNLVEAKLQGLNTSLTGARSTRIRIESDLSMLQTVPGRDPIQLLDIASVAADPQVAAALGRVKTLEADILALSDQYRGKHPRMIEAHNRLEEAKVEEAKAVRSAPDRLAAQYTEAQVTEQTLEKAVAVQEKELLKLDEKTLPYRRLQEELAADRALYDAVQKRLKETTVVMDIKPVNFRVVEPAVPAVRLPNRRLIIAIGAVLAGALFAVGVLAAIFFLDSSIKTVDDAERWLGLPVLSAIPTLRHVQSTAQTLALLNQPDSPMAESFRSLRTALSLLGPVECRKVILFTSAVPSEGKTLNAVNAAIAFAQQGLRTLLLDADLRQPALSLLLLKNNRKLPGVAEYMVGAQVELHATEIANLSILPAGAHAPNPAELLSGERFAELVDTLKLQFDRIIIDTAPVNVVSDTLNIVGAAQTVVLVVRNGNTPRKVVRRALELLARAHVRPDGIALNFMPEWRGIASHYYYSSDEKYGGAETYGKNYHAAGRSKPKAVVPTDVAAAKPLAPSAG